MKKSILTIVAFALVAGGIIFLAKDSNAYKGDPNVNGPNYTQERHAAMEKAFENNDYDSWKELMQGRGRVSQVVNKENFAKFAEAHKLAEQGKMTEATMIRKELGLGNGSGSGSGCGMGRGYRVNN